MSSTVFAYPRYVADTAAARAGVVRIEPFQKQEDMRGCTRLSGRTYILTPPPSHTFHFFLEWAFHLFSLLAAQTEPPRNVLFLPPAARDGQRRLGRLDAWSARVYHALLGQTAATYHMDADCSYCLDHAQIGLMPEVSLVTSRCIAMRRLADANGGRSASCARIPHTEGVLPVELAHARHLTNCSLTRARIRAFRGYVRARIGTIPPPALSKAAAASASSVRLLIVQRGGTTRHLLGLSAFVSHLSAALRLRLRLSSARSVDIRVSDFTANLPLNLALLEDRTALIAVHGNALTNLLLAPPRGLRAGVQLLPSCLPEGTLSNHAYEVLGHLILGGRFRSVCCECQSPRMQKSSHVSCNASAVADALADLLHRSLQHEGPAARLGWSLSGLRGGPSRVARRES